MRTCRFLSTLACLIFALLAGSGCTSKEVFPASVTAHPYRLDNRFPKLRAVVVTASGHIVATGGTSEIYWKDSETAPWKSAATYPGWEFVGSAVSSDRKIIWLAGESTDRKSGRVFVSHDEGVTWNAYLQTLDFRPLAIATTKDGSDVWIAGYKGRVMHARSESKQFDVAMNLGENVFIETLGVLGSTQGILAAGNHGIIAIKRTLEGKLERPTCGVSNELMSFAQDEQRSRLWVAGEGGIICESSDVGVHWKASGWDSWTDDIYRMLFVPQSNRLLALTAGYVEVSDPETLQWQDVELLNDVSLRDLTVDPSHNLLYGVGDNASFFKGDIGGVVWTSITQQDQSLDLRSIATSNDGQRVFAAGVHGSIRWSVDDGSTWQYFRAPSTTTFSTIATTSDGSTAIAAGSSGMVYRWDDKSKQWARLPFDLSSNEIKALWVSPDAQNVVIGDMVGNIYRSTDGGVHWYNTDARQSMRAVTRIAGKSDGKLLVAAGESGLLLASEDLGAHWKELNAPTAGSATSVAVGEDNRIWVVGPENRYSYSDDRGQNWTLKVVQKATKLVDVLTASPYVWLLDENRIYYTVDQDIAVGKLPADSNANLYIGGSVARDSGALWLVTDGGEVVSATPESEAYPHLTSAKVPTSLSTFGDDLSLTFSPSKVCENSGRMLWLTVQSKDGLMSKDATITPVWDDKPEPTVHITFGLPSDLPEKDLRLRVILQCNDTFAIGYLFKDLSVVSWAERVPGGMGTLSAIAALILLPLLSVVAYFLRPSSVLSLRDALGAASFPGAVGTVVTLIQKYLLVNFLARQPRVLDAWIGNVKPEFLKRWETLAFSRSNPVYIPMSVEIDDGAAAKTIAKPRAPDFHELISHDRTCIQLIGPGGIGKTTLAAAMSRWLLDATLLGHIALPIVFDEPMTDPPSAIAKFLKAMLDESAPDADFINALLRKQRLVLIFDRVTEQTEDTQKTVRAVYQNLPACRLCIITARTGIEVDARTARITPVAMNSATTLTTYMEQEIARLDKVNRYPTVAARTSLVARLAHMLELDSGNKITPLLVTMFVELVLSDTRPVDADGPMLPETTTELYLNYFLAGASRNAQSTLNYDQGVAIGGRLGKLALAGRYAPSPFLKADALAVTRELIQAEALSLLEKIVSSGILTQRNRLGKTELSFSIDTLAEVLAAYQLVIENQNSEAWFVQFKAQLPSDQEAAADFLNVVEMVRAALSSRQIGPANQKDAIS
jgi:photosystem II stability/assembly factor-like uncharacterized protein